MKRAILSPDYMLPAWKVGCPVPVFPSRNALPPRLARRGSAAGGAVCVCAAGRGSPVPQVQGGLPSTGGQPPGLQLPPRCTVSEPPKLPAHHPAQPRRPASLSAACVQAEYEYLAKDGLSQDDMLLRSFDEDAAAQPWFAGSHVFPLYPGPAASFSPLCTDVPTLKAGVAEGRRAVMRLAQALLAPLEGAALGEGRRGGRSAGSSGREAEPELLLMESNIMPLASGELGAPHAPAAAARRSRLSRLWGR